MHVKPLLNTSSGEKDTSIRLVAQITEDAGVLVKKNPNHVVLLYDSRPDLIHGL